MSGSRSIFGITIPSNIAKQKIEVKYTEIESGPNIILQSGASIKPTLGELEAFELEKLQV